MAENKIKPCPFCGNKNISSRLVSYDDHAVGIVYCTNCGGQLRYFNDEKMAIELWNRRQNGRQGMT